MDVFQKNYRAYYSVMYITGLWPYDNSIYSNPGVDDKNGRNHVGERTCAVVVLVSDIIVLLAIRWLPLQLSSIKIWVRKHTKRLHASERSNRSGFVNERNSTIETRNPDTNSLDVYGGTPHQCNATTSYSIAVEISDTVSENPWNLFQPESYRLENAINKSAKSDTPIEIDIRSTVEIHQRALEMNRQIQTNMVVQYLAAILTVVVSFAVNLYRVYLVSQNKHEIDNVFITLQIFMAHVMIILLNNYSGQRMINNSVDFFHNTYNTLWYCIPLRSQKLLLFIMMRSINEVKFNLAGLFAPCYEGFTTMMSSSFSYFTVISSV
ncbi:uncharacterized protein LOC143175093 [Nomia melanderi]|uniref:uncharacterized protein LOC143175093 n=1 Tax=Nomia melanderi TaxID=2448451 RepID=UPI003FCC2B6F